MRTDSANKLQNGERVTNPACPSASFVGELLDIQRDWKYTRTVTDTETIFAFERSGECPGYSIHISNWCLRQDLKSPNGKTGHIYSSLSWILTEISRMIGTGVFFKTARAFSKLHERISRPEGGPIGRNFCIASAKSEFINALIGDILSPSAATFSVPLLTLHMLNKTQYVVEKRTWQPEDPPYSLSHLATSAFGSHLNLGILAFPCLMDDVWVVSNFTQCDGKMTWERRWCQNDVLRTEFSLVYEFCDLVRTSMSKINMEQALAITPECAGTPSDIISVIHAILKKHQDYTLPQESCDSDERPLTPCPRYMLRQKCGTWHFSIDGMEGFIADMKGLCYVEYLLKNPSSIPIHATQLQANVGDFKFTTGSSTEFIDQTTEMRAPMSPHCRLGERNAALDNRLANKKMWELRREYMRIIEDDNATETDKKEAMKEKANIDKILNSSLLRDKGNSAKTYDRIRQAISRLVARLNDFRPQNGDKNPAYQAFAQHLSKYLITASSRFSGNPTSRTRTGTAQTFKYEPPDDVVWSD